MNTLLKKLNQKDSSPYVIGMMSGTSLDGLDAVICQFHDNPQQPLSLLATHSLDFPTELRQALFALTQPNGVDDFIEQNSREFISELDVFGWASVEYGKFASQVVLELLTKANISADAVLAIGCHGQTVRHRPQWHFSLQLIDPNILAELTNIAVVSDFRRRDMAVGGQGAPLVPAFHQAIFAQQGQSRVILNLGGIANITVLDDLDKVIGFDTGVANLLLDAWCLRHTEQPFDSHGNWAKSGQILQPLLDKFLTHEFFAKEPPKSTGREEFHLGWVDDMLEQLNHELPNLRYSSTDVQTTLTELTAITASQAIDKFAKVNKQANQLFVCGGGAYNDYLLQRIQHHLPNWTVATTQDFGLSPRWVEAVAFAWLARQMILGQTGNLPKVTGASKQVVLGQICV